MKTGFTAVAILMFLLNGCPENHETRDLMIMTEAPLIIYKTRQDYSTRVPVMMDEGKTGIIAFPDPRDLYFEGRLALPTPLIKGYLLDNRGLTPYSAFLTYTYQEYSALAGPPDPEELMRNILDKDPFTEMYNCGTRSDYNDLEKDVKRLIRSNFENCRKIR